MASNSLQKVFILINDHHIQPTNSININLQAIFNTSTANMRTSFITLIGLFAGSMAMPATRVTQRQAAVCSSGTSQCCDVDVLGIADLDCEARKFSPTQFQRMLKDPPQQRNLTDVTNYSPFYSHRHP
jgi:hypothetical protein